MKNNDLDKLFKEKLHNREVPYNPAAWKRAEAALNSRASSGTGAGRILKIAASVIAVLGLSILGYFMFTPDENTAITANAEDNAQQEQLTEEKSAENSNTASNKPFEENAEAGVSDANSENAKTGSSSSDAADGVGSGNNNDDNEREYQTAQSASSAAASQRDRRERRELEDVIDRMASIGKQPEFNFNGNLELYPKDVYLRGDLPDLMPMILNRISLIAGVSGSRGWSGGPEAGNYSADMMFGLGYERILNPAWSVEINALYRERSNSGLQHEMQFTQYSFGKEDITLQYTNEKARYLEIPVFANYRFNTKHSVQAGASANILLSSDDRWLYKVENQYDDLNQDRMLQPSDQEVVSEVSNLNIMLQAGYQYEILPGFTAGTRLAYGLNSFSSNQNYDNEVSHRNLFLSGYLKYHVLNF